MRCMNIEVSLKIPVRINEKDFNGVYYSEELIQNACEKVENVPIILYDSNGKTIVVGYSNSIKYEEGFIIVNGIIFGGGTSEKVITNGISKVLSMDIAEIGIGL